jgi:hypothetical protein
VFSFLGHLVEGLAQKGMKNRKELKILYKIKGLFQERKNQQIGQ